MSLCVNKTKAPFEPHYQDKMLYLHGNFVPVYNLLILDIIGNRNPDRG